MQKKKAKGSVKFSHPLQYALINVMVNRFTFDREDGFVLAHFGLVGSSDRLIDGFACVFPESMLKSQKENLVQYSDKIGLPKKKFPAWQPPQKKSEVGWLPVVDFIHLCNWDDAYAEICFWNYSQGRIADSIQAGQETTVTPNGVALLRCSLEMQRAFLDQLYQAE